MAEPLYPPPPGGGGIEGAPPRVRHYAIGGPTLNCGKREEKEDWREDRGGRGIPRPCGYPDKDSSKRPPREWRGATVPAWDGLRYGKESSKMGREERFQYIARSDQAVLDVKNPVVCGTLRTNRKNNPSPRGTVEVIHISLLGVKSYDW